MRPDFSITADGKNITALLRDRLISIRITDKVGLDSDEVEISLDDRDGAVAIPRTGAQLEVSLGYTETGLTRIGRYAVDEIESSGPPQMLIIRARPADMAGTLKSVRKHAWEGVTLAQVVQDIATRNKLKPVCQIKARVERLDQLNESDLHFITRVAKQYDATATVKGGQLLVLPRGGQQKNASGKPLPVIVLNRADIKSWRYTQSERDASGGVAVKHHDQRSGKTLTILAPDSDNPKAPVQTTRHTVPAKGRAAASAQGALKRSKRATKQLTLTLAGRADLVAERSIRASGIKPGVDGLYPAETVTQDFSHDGWITTVELSAGKTPPKKKATANKQKTAKPLQKLTPP